MASRDRATSSARFSHSNSSGRADLKIKPTWLAWSLNCDAFFFVPNLEHVKHWASEGGNCSVVQSLFHVGHCLFIAVANALHHQPFLKVLWLGHMSSRSLNRSWLIISVWNKFCDDDAPRFRSSWMRPRVGVLSWHSNSSCSLLVVLSLVPTNFCVFCLAVLVQLGIYLSGLCPILPYVSIVFLLQRGTRETRSSFSWKWSFSAKVHLSFGTWLLSSPLLATLPLRGRVFPPYISLCSSVEEVVVMSYVIPPLSSWGVVAGYLDVLDQQFQYGGEFSCIIFFLSQNRVVNLIDFLEKFFSGGEGGQVYSLIRQYSAARGMHMRHS